MSYGSYAPESWYGIPKMLRYVWGHLDEETCVIRGDDFFKKNYFIKGNIEIPVQDSSQPFAYTVWVSLSKKNFSRALKLWKDPQRTKDPPSFGWLCTNLPVYPNTINLKTQVHMREVGVRPYIELEPTKHPLAIEQREGITMARIKEIAELILHGWG